MSKRVIVLLGAGALLAACSSTSEPSPSPSVAAGTVVGDVEGGCFGPTGPPDSVTVTVQAMQGAKVKGFTTVTETKSDTSGGPFRMLGTRYRLTVLPGDYAIVVGGPNFTLNGKPRLLGNVSVRPGETTAVPSAPVSACS